LDEIISRILDSEDMAQRVIDEARREKMSHESDMAEEIEKYQYFAHKEIWGKIGEHAEKLKRETADNVRRIEGSAQQQIDGMMSKVEQHKEEWLEHLYKKILEGGIG
jgi:vacuolar-type H+-ATPase subunit H